MLIDEIRADLKTAMKARDALTLRTLRSVVAAVQEANTSGKGPDTQDDEAVLKIIAHQVKQRGEAAEAFDKGDRPEKAADERAEAEVLKGYLPAGLEEAELVALVEATLAENGLSDKSDMGAAMKAVNAAVAGRADGRTVADLVKARLN